MAIHDSTPPWAGPLVATPFVYDWKEVRAGFRCHAVLGAPGARSIAGAIPSALRHQSNLCIADGARQAATDDPHADAVGALAECRGSVADYGDPTPFAGGSAMTTSRHPGERQWLADAFGRALRDLVSER